ncbi:MAG: hypothetical protein PHG58_07590, partial [Clostridia bacterium]|nr:hypothetical protein [Clostridia bacterium]
MGGNKSGISIISSGDLLLWLFLQPSFFAALRLNTQLSHIEIFRRFLNIKDSEAQKWFKNALTFCSDRNKKSIKDF